MTMLFGDVASDCVLIRHALRASGTLASFSASPYWPEYPLIEEMRTSKWQDKHHLWQGCWCNDDYDPDYGWARRLNDFHVIGGRWLESCDKLALVIARNWRDIHAPGFNYAYWWLESLEPSKFIPAETDPDNALGTRDLHFLTYMCGWCGSMRSRLNYYREIYKRDPFSSLWHENPEDKTNDNSSHN